MRKHFNTITTTSIAVLTLAIIAGCGRQEVVVDPPTIGLHVAALQGNLDAIRQHIAADSDLNERDPLGGGTPLITAATFGQTEVARALIKAGADVDCQNNEGSTALHTAAFLCRTKIVEVLIENGADKSVRNNVMATALESVAGPFNEVQGIYDLLAEILGPLGLQLDYEQLKATRPIIAEMLQ